MSKFILLIFLVGFTMSGSVNADEPRQGGSKYIRLSVISGVEAEVISIAAQKFHSENLDVSPRYYDVSVYLHNEEYIVFFEKARNVPPGVKVPTYEVVVSAKNLKLVHSQFSR